MEGFRDMLAAKAKTVIPGQDYNAFRSRQQAVEPAPLHFEDMLPSSRPEKALVERVVPSFVRFLHRKKMDPANPGDVVVALFVGELCYVLPSDGLLDLFCEIEGTTRQGLSFRLLGWLDS